MAWSTLKIVAIFAVSALSLTSGQNSEGKLQIDVHYENRCPDSRDFVQNQLRRAYPRIKDSVEINYVPFGKANSYSSRNGETLFSCQHGVRECEGNKYQSCVLDVIGKDKDKATSFVTCAMNFVNTASNCAQNLGLDMGKINQCANGERGKILQLEAEKFSKNVIARSGFVPSIVYDGIFKAGDNWASLEDFEAVVNDKLQARA